MKKLYTKQQLAEALTSFARANKTMKDIMASAEPVIESAVKGSVTKADGLMFMTNKKGSFLTLEQAVPIISPLFNSFIELYFVDQARLRTIRKSELTKEEIEEGQWELIRKYRSADITTESLYNSLDVDALDGAVVRLRLELDTNDIASIYETESFSVTEQDEAFTVWAGNAILAQCKYDSNVPQE